MFDSGPARALTRELLAMTPGTSQFVQRLRDITAVLDGEQARLNCAPSGRPARVSRRPRKTTDR